MARYTAIDTSPCFIALDSPHLVIPGTFEHAGGRRLAVRVHFGKLLVAIANKHARHLWAMLARGQPYDPEAWLHHPMVQRSAGRHAMSNAMA